MATNLRLRDEAAQAVKREAERSGRSQQEVIREAIDRHLGLSASGASGGALDGLVAAGQVIRPRIPFRKVPHRITLPAGKTSVDLLDRQDRI